MKAKKETCLPVFGLWSICGFKTHRYSMKIFLKYSKPDLIFYFGWNPSI
jgi:hypothetical protein